MTELDALPDYRDQLVGRLRESHVGFDVDVVGLRAGTYDGRAPMECLRSPYAYHRALGQVLDNAVAAQAHEYAAFAMASWVAPFLRAARSAVDIPVASMAESVLAVACSVGRRFVLVCINDDQARLVGELVEELMFDARVAAIVPLDLAVVEDKVAAALASNQSVAESAVRAARVGIALGGDVVIPAEGILSEALQRHGIKEVDGAPVLDCVGVVLEHTAMLARLWQDAGLRVARIWSYPKAPAGSP
jgi:allantoin racemase